ncbi:MAG: helical backbone metal receptor [Burkholderiaceae bacterium]|nr:helical backbone metal receptor [Burkholderiaceae bacterium]
MKKRVWRALWRRGIVLSLCAGFWTAALAQPATDAGLLRDDWGRALPAVPRPTRIVVLAPHLTESLAVAGLLGQVIAIDANSDFPAEVADLEHIRAYPPPGPERLLALRAQWVMVWAPGISRSWVERVERTGITVFVSDPRTLGDVAGNIERFAAISAQPQLAHAAALAFHARLARLEQRFSGRAPVSVFYQVWARPLVSLGSGDVTADAMRVCGARNVFAGAALAAPQVSEEAVLAARPRLIVAADHPDSALRWRRLGAIAPAGFAHFAYLEPSAIQRPGPRILDAVEQLCEMVDAAR